MALSYAGSFGLIWLALALAIAGCSRSRTWLWLQVGVAILVAEGVSRLLKHWVGRDRPPVASAEPLVDVPSSDSFPSGHATIGFACATVLALAAPHVRIPLYALAVLISFSRVYVGVHYPFDVLGGAVLGLLLGVAIARRVWRNVARRRGVLGVPRQGRREPR